MLNERPRLSSGHFRQAAGPARRGARGPGAAPDQRRCEVLVAEDDDLIREQLAELLRDEGYTVATASNGREALDQMNQLDIGVLILDLMMPVMSGWDLAAVLRGTPELSGIPVLTITAVGNAHRAPGGPVFLKPLNLESLVRAVAMHLGPRH